MRATTQVLFDGSRSMIVFSVKRKYAYAVAMGDTIRLVKLDGLRGLRPVIYRDKPYPVKRAVRIYLRSTQPKTKRAAQVLRGLLRRKNEIHDEAPRHHRDDVGAGK
jgi:hypothetical protein